MIEERYCSFEVAKLLKEKGFDKGCPTTYTYNGLFQFKNYKPLNSDILAPTHQMAVDFLRKKYNIYLWVQPHEYDIVEHKASGYVFCLYQGDNYYEPCTKDYPTFKEAVEAGLMHCLINLI